MIKNRIVLIQFFYEYSSINADSKNVLIEKLKEIYSEGFVSSHRLDRDGNIQPYKAQNGAGFTLESYFNIIPNGRSEPDFMDWELKAHSGSAITLMTPEPNSGTYCADIYSFLREYASSIKPNRLNFASRHDIDKFNEKTKLVLKLDGYNPKTKKLRILMVVCFLKIKMM